MSTVRGGKGRGDVKATLATGGGFATTVATIFGVAGKYSLGDQATLYALGAVCLIAALTMFTAAFMTRP